MNLPLLFPAIAALLLPALTRAQSLTAEYCGIQIVTKGYGKEGDSVRAFQESKAGVKVSFLIQSPDGGIIALDEDQSKIEAFTDDKGIKSMDSESFSNGFDQFFSISADGKAATFTLQGSVEPPATLQKVIAKGTMAVKVATKKELMKGGAVKEGAEITCGPQKLEITEFISEDGKASISLDSAESFDRIVEMKWFDASGKELEAEDDGGGSTGLSAEISGSRLLGVRNYHEYVIVKGTPATVEFVAWTDMKTVQVPFSATVAAGVVK